MFVIVVIKTIGVFMKVEVVESEKKLDNADLQLINIDRVIRTHLKCIDALINILNSSHLVTSNRVFLLNTMELHKLDVERLETERKDIASKNMLEKEKSQEWKYPCLLESHDGEDIILATEENTDDDGDLVMDGTVIKSLDYKIGFEDDSWLKAKFNLFTGKVTLSND
jgi:hypothetical protein